MSAPQNQAAAYGEVVAYLESERENLVTDNEESEARIRLLEATLTDYQALLAISEADHQRILADYKELLDQRAALISKYARLVDTLLGLLPPPTTGGLPALRIGSPSLLQGLIGPDLGD